MRDTGYSPFVDWLEFDVPDFPRDVNAIHPEISREKDRFLYGALGSSRRNPKMDRILAMWEKRFR